MPRSSPQLYLTATSDGSTYQSLTARRMTNVSPGTTVSNATTLAAPSLLAGTFGYLVGESSYRNEAFSLGEFRGTGWILNTAAAVSSGFLTFNTDSFRVLAGTWTFLIKHSRAGGLLTGDVSGNLRACLFRVNSISSNSYVHLGTGPDVAYTCTTSVGTTTLTVTTSEFQLDPGQCLFLEIYGSAAASATADTVRFQTNSTTGSLISQAPNFIRLYKNSLSDNVIISESISRSYLGSRALSDTMLVSDFGVLNSTYRRSLSDGITPINDSIQRLYQAKRSLSDNQNISEQISRSFTGTRSLSDNVSNSDSLTRSVNYRRSIEDNLSSASIVNVINPVFCSSD